MNKLLDQWRRMSKPARLRLSIGGGVALVLLVLVVVRLTSGGGEKVKSADRDRADAIRGELQHQEDSKPPEPAVPEETPDPNGPQAVPKGGVGGG